MCDNVGNGATYIYFRVSYPGPEVDMIPIHLHTWVKESRKLFPFKCIVDIGCEFKVAAGGTVTA